jgi:hypothetical protein
MDIPDEDQGIFDGIERFAFARGFVHGQSVAARRILIRLGKARFGEYGPAVAAAIDGFSNTYRYEDLIVRIPTASS